MAVVHHSLRTFAPTSGLKCLANSLRLYSQKSATPPPPRVSVEVDKSGVATVTMCRPPVNGLNTALLAALGDSIKALEKDKARGMILTSNAETVFSAGLDINEMYNTPKDRLANFWTTLQSTWLALYRTSFPTVAAINGHAPAGGCLLALSCEYRVMVGPQYKIGLNETQLGIVAPPWFVICMQDAVGKRQTELSLTTGRMHTAPEALNIGLIDKMVSNKDEAIIEAQNFIAQFARIPPLARKVSKENIRKEGIQFMEQYAVDDLKNFVDFALQPNVQKGLGLYLESLKQSKESK